MQNNPYHSPQSELDLTGSGQGESMPAEPALKPWLSIWFKPRETMRYLVATQINRQVLLLSLMVGFMLNLMIFAGKLPKGDNDALSLIAIASVLAPLSGWLGLHLWALLLRWGGALLGGRATQAQLRCALAWASVPVLALLFIMSVEFLLVSNSMTTGAPGLLADYPLVRKYAGVFTLLRFVFVIWWIVLQFKCVSEVQGFSTWYAVCSFHIAGFILYLGIRILKAALMFFA